MATEEHYDAYYSKCKLVEVSTPSNDLPENAKKEQVIYRRKHPTYLKRILQLKINLLGLKGGRPYVQERLSRFAGETSIDWQGGTRADGSKATGRLQQTHAFPYLGRINDKINQYVFSKEPEREGIDEEVAKDITRDGCSVNDVMREISSLLFACKWCWVGVDAPPAKGEGEEYTIAEKESEKIRPYWNVYDPTQVLDWHFNEKGELEWIKTIHLEYNDADPGAIPEAKTVVRLWEKGKVTDIYEEKATNTTDGVTYKLVEQTLSLKDRIPFFPVGKVSDDPTAFDDLESINRTIMDLGSVDRANFFNCSYPQMILPLSVIQNVIQSGFASNATEAGKLIVGFKNPILVDKEDQMPNYLMPDTSIMTIGERILQLKRELFEVVGLALEQESRQVASAEAKAWDFLDVASVMKSRAEVLQDAEVKAVELSRAWDSSFPEWTPEYNKDFDIGDFKDEISALIMAGNMPLPASVSREIVKKLVDRLDRLGTPIDEETKTRIFEELLSWDPNAFGETPSAIEEE
jgi:hypothetical protein